MTTPRITPVSLPLRGADAERMGRLVPPTQPPPNLFLTVARHARLWSFMVDSGMIGPTGLMDLRSLAPRLREIVVLRTCVANRCDYEFNLHVQTISERCGLSNAHIEGIRSVKPEGDWSEPELAAMELVDALVLRRAVNDMEFARARASHGDEALIEITHLVGLYTGVAMMVALACPEFDIYRIANPVLSQSGRGPK